MTHSTQSLHMERCAKVSSGSLLLCHLKLENSKACCRPLCYGMEAGQLATKEELWRCMRCGSCDGWHGRRESASHGYVTVKAKLQDVEARFDEITLGSLGFKLACICLLGYEKSGQASTVRKREIRAAVFPATKTGAGCPS